MAKKSKILQLFSFALVFSVLVFGSMFLNCPQNETASAEGDSVEKLTSAKAMCVCEQTTGRVLYEKNADERLPMASLTKIITAIVAIENNPNLDKTVEIPQQATKIEGSTIYLSPGEHLTIRDLLYGLMLRSGNDAAVALALETSGSVENFMALCNEFCASLGAKDTNLVTPNGLHNDKHFTTARDLAKITSYALSNPTFAEIVSTTRYTCPNEKKPDGNRIMKNKNKLLAQMDGATGVKTGFTKKAGRCFVGSAKRDNMQLVCVLLNCNPMFEECNKLLEKGFSEFKMVDLLSPYLTHDTLPVENSDTKFVNTYSRNSFVYPLKNEELSAVQIEKVLPEKVVAPLKDNAEIGKIEIKIANDLIFCEKIYTIKGVEANDFKSKLEKILQKM